MYEEGALVVDQTDDAHFDDFQGEPGGGGRRLELLAGA